MYYLIVGPTCSGKDKIANYVINDIANMSPIISTTSRPIRPKEKEGLEYHFLTPKEFLTRVENDNFIEHRSYETIVKNVKDVWYYGVEKSSVGNEDTDYVAVISYQGALKFREYFGKDNIILLYIQSTYPQRYIRNVLRGDFDAAEWSRRNSDDAEWLDEACKDADYIIPNYGWDVPPSSISHNYKIDISDNSGNHFEITKSVVNSIIDDIRNNKY